MRQNIQLFRNANLYSSYTDAVAGLNQGLSQAKDGEMLVSRYKVGEDGYRIVLGVVTVDGETRTINIVDEVSKVLEKVLGGATVITSFKDVEFVATNLLGEIKEGKDNWDDQAKEFKKAVEDLKEAVGENGSVAEQIQSAIEEIDAEDEAVEGEVVKAVSQVNGVISVSRGFLADTDIKIVKNTEGLDANVLEEFVLENGEGTQLGEVIKIYKDQNLKDVKFEDQKLIFTYAIANGTDKTVEVDVSAFLTEEEYAEGLKVVDHKVSVKSANEKHIVATEDGVDLGENAVVYSEFTYFADKDGDGVKEEHQRKTIQLKNYDSLSGIATDGTGHNLAMVSIWDVADFGAPRLHMNLNSKDAVTINDVDEVAVLKPFVHNGVERKTLQLNNFDSISGLGANCEEGQLNGYEGGENLEGQGFNLAMVSIWNVADFGSSRLHMNLNSKVVDGRPNVTVNDEEVVAYLSDITKASSDMLGVPEGHNESELQFKSIWDLDQEAKRLDENKAQKFEINPVADSNITVESSVEKKNGVDTTIFNIGLNGVNGGTWD